MKHRFSEPLGLGFDNVPGEPILEAGINRIRESDR